MQGGTSPTDSMIALLTARTCYDYFISQISHHCCEAGIIRINENHQLGDQMSIFAGER